MIRSFGDKETEKLFNGQSPKKIESNIQRKAFRQLVQIHISKNLIDLNTPPGNRLHALKGDLKDYYSISINKQWRIIFQWDQGHAYEVEVVDYH